MSKQQYDLSKKSDYLKKLRETDFYTYKEKTKRYREKYMKYLALLASRWRL